MKAQSQKPRKQSESNLSLSQQTRKVGFVGTGTMGRAMIERLLDEGFEVHIQNRTRSHAADLEARGAIWHDLPSQVAEECRVIHSCLRDSAAVEAVYLGANGLLAGNSESRVFIEHATFAPTVAKRIAGEAERQGNLFADIPVSGGPERARDGDLASMAGGSPKVLKMAELSLNAMCSVFHHIGPPGHGLKLKLVNQLLVGVHVSAATDAIRMIEALGLPYETSCVILESGWADSAMLRRTAAQLPTGSTTNTGVTIGGMNEVLGLVEELLVETGQHSSVFSASRQQFSDHATKAEPDDDLAALKVLSSVPSKKE